MITTSQWWCLPPGMEVCDDLYEDWEWQHDENHWEPTLQCKAVWRVWTLLSPYPSDHEDNVGYNDMLDDEIPF